MLGKYVHIVLKGKGQLTLCEVEVYVNSKFSILEHLVAVKTSANERALEIQTK